MKINVRSSLPYVDTTIIFNKKQLILSKVIIDTGSSSSIFNVDIVSDIGLQLEPNDSIHRVCGVGGSEFVFTKQLDHLQVGNLIINDFNVEIGAMDYGINFKGIIGMDFLLEVKAVIDFEKLEIRSK